MPELIEQVLERSGYLESLEAERTIEAQGRIENLQELVALAREWQEQRRRADALVVPPGGLALLRPGRDPRRGLARHADDAAQREGARVPRRLPDRHGGGDLPALALDRGAGRRGGAPALLRRHDAGDGEADADARLVADALRRPLLQPRRRASSTSCRSGTSSGSGSARPRGRTTGRRSRARSRRASDVPSLSTGDTVRHGTLGEGVVVRIEAGGVVTVRFADDGSERRLMLDYAPLEKIWAETAATRPRSSP